MSSWKDIWKTLTTGPNGKRYPPGLSPHRPFGNRRLRYREYRQLRRTAPSALIASAVMFFIMSAAFYFFGKKYGEIERSPEYAQALASWKALRDSHLSFQAAALDDASLEVLRLLDAVPATAEDKAPARNLSRRIANARQGRDRELRDRARAKEAALQRQAEEDAQRERQQQAMRAAPPSTAQPQRGMDLADFEAQFGDCFAFSKKIRLEDNQLTDLWDFQPSDGCLQRLADYRERSVLFRDGKLYAFAMRRDRGGEGHGGQAVQSDAHGEEVLRQSERAVQPRRPLIDAYGNAASLHRAPSAPQRPQRPRRVDANGNEISSDAQQADVSPLQRDPYSAPRVHPDSQPVVADPYGAPATPP